MSFSNLHTAQNSPSQDASSTSASALPRAGQQTSSIEDIGEALQRSGPPLPATRPQRFHTTTHHGDPHTLSAQTGSRTTATDSASTQQLLGRRSRPSSPQALRRGPLPATTALLPPHLTRRLGTIADVRPGVIHLHASDGASLQLSSPANLVSSGQWILRAVVAVHMLLSSSSPPSSSISDETRESISWLKGELRHMLERIRDSVGGEGLENLLWAWLHACLRGEVDWRAQREAHRRRAEDLEHEEGEGEREERRALRHERLAALKRSRTRVRELSSDLAALRSVIVFITSSLRLVANELLPPYVALQADDVAPPPYSLSPVPSQSRPAYSIASPAAPPNDSTTTPTTSYDSAVGGVSSPPSGSAAIAQLCPADEALESSSRARLKREGRDSSSRRSLSRASSTDPTSVRPPPAPSCRARARPLTPPSFVPPPLRAPLPSSMSSAHTDFLEWLSRPPTLSDARKGKCWRPWSIAAACDSSFLDA